MHTDPTNESNKNENAADIKKLKNFPRLKEFPNYEEELPLFSKELIEVCKKPLQPKTIRMIDPKNVTDFWEKLLRDRSEGADVVKSYFQRTFESELKLGAGMFARRLILARSPKCLSVLKQEFPHFERSGVIDAIQEDLILSKLSGGVLSIAPILMKSGPGLGKNRFVRRIQEVLRIPILRTFDFSTASAGWTISGLNSSWANAKPGEVFQTLTSINGIGNPLFFLDEVEKGANARNASRAVDCLHTLLEPESARTFTDEFCPIAVDTSRIIWIAAANSFENIPLSIISRFRVFEIPPPSHEEKRLIVESIWKDMIKHNLWGKHLSPKLTEEILYHFDTESLRTVQRVLRSAAAQALSLVGKNLPKEKIQISLKNIVSEQKIRPKKRPMGFFVQTDIAHSTDESCSK